MGTLRAELHTFMILCSILLKMRNVLDKSCTENQNTLSTLSDLFLKIMLFMRQCRKTLQSQTATDENIIWGTSTACWISKATDAHSKYVTLIAFQQQQWLNKHTLRLHYTYSPYLVVLNYHKKYVTTSTVRNM
jgi:hypothetical protein